MNPPFWRLFIPGMLTSMNLLCGVLSIILSFRNEFEQATLLILSAAVLDFLDGFVARALKGSSAFGKELDSLADVVTFGVAPGLLMFTFDLSLNDPRYMEGIPHAYTGAWLTLSLPVFAALRLARFNIDTAQHDGFLGVPTPAMSMFFIGLPVILRNYSDSLPAEWLNTPYVIPAMALLFSALMVIPFPLIALKFPKGYGWNGNAARYLLLTGSVVLIIWAQLAALPLVILWYILLSVANNLFTASRI